MSSVPHPVGSPPASTPTATPDVGRCLTALEQKVLWLSTWMIHHANHVRPSRDGLKVGGHQASCASMVTLMTALYFDVLRPIDRVAVKPHGSPVYHAIQYLFGNQSRDQLERFRAFGGAQSYPSRTKDLDDVDISTVFEPAFVDELTEILRWSFDHIQSDDGGAVYLRQSTRPLAQPRVSCRRRYGPGSWTAGTGWCHRRRAPSSRSWSAARSSPKRSRRTVRSSRTSRARGCSSSRRPAVCNRPGCRR